ncbi:MAG: nucleotidyltransferase domain-containing protein [Candidatus Omnitrophica bacterium]|nr:nucleotidyltransferase domain-containing protein [Candidatus Omnitrophota bacterium]MBU0881175.1 nucleotidyltransferase domain-containing protein [Candidatus Omnitrophota bacterium]MBU1037627.1 nucleotidyltransferase domain-containing protein [Candidatus Omnitrophota bacterium]MBU1809256.1 nucleotidyltransferase domain-containing protein [Candidatus Omnitrophota bacterium]
MTPFTNSKLRSKLLSYFFTNPEQSLYVRELGVILDLDPGNLSRDLRKLEQEGIFTSYTKGQIKFYSLDKKYPLFSDLKNIIFKTEGVEGSLRQLVSEYVGIVLAFIYGSYAKGKERGPSDIDVVVVGSFPRDEFTRKLRVLEAKLNKEVNFNSYTKAEFGKESKKNGGFLNMVIKGKVILLKGNLGD